MLVSPNIGIVILVGAFAAFAFTSGIVNFGLGLRLRRLGAAVALR